MTRMMCVIGVSLLAACVSSGCATSAALKAVDVRTTELEAKLTVVQTLSDDLTKMETTLQDTAKKLDAQVAAQNKDLTAMRDSIKAELDEIKKLDGSLITLRQDTDKRFEDAGKRAGKTETDVAALGQQLPVMKAEIAQFDVQFKLMSASIDQAHALIVKNLENARDIYKTQFLALEEVLQNIKKAKTPEPPKEPAPEK